MSGFIVLIGTHPGQEASGPFTSRSFAERLADDLRVPGIRAEVIGLVTARDAREFFGIRPIPPGSPDSHEWLGMDR